MRGIFEGGSANSESSMGKERFRDSASVGAEVGKIVGTIRESRYGFGGLSSDEGGSAPLLCDFFLFYFFF